MIHTSQSILTKQIGSIVAETSKKIADAITNSKEVKSAIDGVKRFNSYIERLFIFL